MAELTEILAWTKRAWNGIACRIAAAEADKGVEKARREARLAGRRVAVVTGASGGVGRAPARRLAEAGFDVALFARGETGLGAVAREVEKRGARALSLAVDVTSCDEVERAARRVESELGAIDVWVNDAMTTVFAPLEEIEPEDFARAVEVSFLGQVWGRMTALKRMRPRDSGTVVKVGSALAYIGIPLQSAYCASNFACRGYFESVRAELLHEKSRVKMAMVHLPAVNTPQFDWSAIDRYPQPVPPLYQPEIAAKFIVQAALGGQREKVVGSWNKLLVLAGRLAPGLGNQYASLGAWETQLTSEQIDPRRPGNLRSPLDSSREHGAHGGFDERAGGFAGPSFLTNLPKTGLIFARAVKATAKEKVELYRARIDQAA